MKINFETKFQGQKVVVNFEGSITELAQLSKLERTELAEWIRLFDENKYNLERILNQYMDIGANLTKNMLDKQSEVDSYQRTISKDEVPESDKDEFEEVIGKSWDEL